MNDVWRIAMAGLLFCAFLGSPVEAAVVINHTRVVYPAQESEVTVQLVNKGNAPALVQTWLDAGDEKSTPDSVKVPFAVTPPVFRLDAGKSGVVRLAYTNEPLPTDKESLFYLNVFDVPPKSANNGRNTLEFAVRTRIKVFFRPAGLPGDAAGAAHKLTWKLVDAEGGKGFALQVANPTPYHVNFAKVGLGVGENSIPAKGSGGMVAPGGTRVFPLKDLTARPAGEAKAQFDVINDAGAINTMTQPLAP